MNKQAYFRFIPSLLALALAACATTEIQKPVVSVTPVQQITSTNESTLNVQARKKYALDLQTQSKLNEAQIQWRILLAIEPNNAEFRNRLRVLQALINRRAKNIILQGHNAFERNNIKEAEKFYLSALLLDPFNIEALESLRTIQTKTLSRLQEIKTAKLLKQHTASLSPSDHDVSEQGQERFYFDLGVQMFSQQDWFGAVREIGVFLASNPQDEQAREYFALAQFQLALTQRNEGSLESSLKHLKEAILYTRTAPQDWYDMVSQIKYELAESYYVSGVQSVRDNMDVAIEMWQKALMNNPRHEKAQFRLDNAIQMKKNLSRMVDSETR